MALYFQHYVDDYRIRSASLADAAAATEVYRADEVAFSGRATMTAELVRADWSTPGRELSRDAWVAETHENQIVAVADVATQDDGVRIWGGAVVHPEHLGHGLGGALLGLVEARAREFAELAPEGVRSTLLLNINPRNSEARTLVEARGYTFTRRFWQMSVELKQYTPENADLPEGVSIRTLVPGQDDRATFEAVEEAFADHWGHTPSNYDQWRHWVLEGEWSDASLIFLATEGPRIVGVAICSQILGPEIGYVNTLGVLRPWRRGGLGRALLLRAFDEFARRGAHEVSLGVDSESLTGATRLYESVGMRVVDEADRYELELRPGRDVSTQTLAVEVPVAE